MKDLPEQPDTTTSTASGQERYPSYDALWHLSALRVLDDDGVHAGLKDAPREDRATRVAIIDTSVAVEHPNLVGAVNTELAFDLLSTRLGAFPYPGESGKLDELDLDRETRIAEDLAETSKLLSELNKRLIPGKAKRHGTIRPATAPEFSTHGTAIAGLVGARPCIATAREGDIALPYAGLDPRCEIVPISTGFDPDPEQLILAFLYAELIGADVILLPRIIPDPARTTPELSGRIVDGQELGDLVATVATTEHEAILWKELSELIVRVSVNRPVVCAAGNSNEEFAIYPANMADEHNGIVSVGALNAKGFRSGYSDARHVTVMAPSNDSEVFDRNEVRQDTQRHDYDKDATPADNVNHKFSGFDIVSTDVPGRFGYATGPSMAPNAVVGMLEFGSYFCRFGGTSAASAIVAGFLALGRSTGAIEAQADGLAAKNWLLAQCRDVAEGTEEGDPAHRIHRVPTWTGEPAFPDAPAVARQTE